MVKRLQTKMLLLLGLLFVGAGMTWAEEFTSTLFFTEKCNGFGTADDGVKWTVTSDASEYEFDSDRGIHYGNSNNGKVSNIVLTANLGINSGKIKTIVVEASGNNSPTLSVTVGGNAFGNAVTDLPNSNNSYTFTETEGVDADVIVIKLAKKEKVKGALFVKSVSVTYEYDPPVATPVFTPVTGTTFGYNGLDVTISCETSGASIYYTLDGSIPNNNSTLYNGAIFLTETKTIKAVAYDDENNHSPVVIATYTYIDPNPSIMIKFGSANGSTIINSQNVEGYDSDGNKWTITNDTYTFNQNANYSQVGGKSKKAASIITFTMTLPEEVTLASIEAKFSGHSETEGTITLKVDNTPVGTGSLNETNEVVVSSTSVSGKTLTITVTDIKNGVNCYYISYRIQGIKITMNNLGIRTYAASNRPLDFSEVEGLTAYAATGITGDKLTLTEVQQAKAGEGLMLKGTAGTTYTVPMADAVPAAIQGNMLVGLKQETEVPQVDGDYTTFILAAPDGGEINWYMLREDSYNLRANSAYLKLPNNLVPATRALTMDYSSDTDGINSLTTRPTNDGNVYDLQGRKVNTLNKKGIYIIGGRKVVVK